MPDCNKQFKKQAQSIRLSTAEKRDVRERLVAYMAYHPLATARQTTDTTQATTGNRFTLTAEAFRTISFNKKVFGRFALMTSLFFVVSVPLLAEQALPGDVLYPMKVQVNEEMRASLSFSPYAKIEWETTRLERRLAEARLLASAGRLTDEAEATVVEAVKKHTSVAQASIEKLRSDNTEEAALASLSLSSVLQVQDELFTVELSGATDPELGQAPDSPSPIAMAVKEARTLANPDDVSLTDISPSRLLALIERDSTYATELFRSLQKKLSDEDRAAIERRLVDVQRKVTTAQDNYADVSVVSVVDEAPDTSETVVIATTSVTDLSVTAVPETNPTVMLLHSALLDIRKLITFMTRIGVEQEWLLDRYVPITLTDEERRTILEQQALEVERLYQAIQTREPDVAIAQKVTAGLERYAELQTSLDAVKNSEDITQAESLMTEIIELLQDIKSLVADSPMVTETTEAEIIDVELEQATTSASTTPSDV